MFNLKTAAQEVAKEAKEAGKKRGFMGEVEDALDEILASIEAGGSYSALAAKAGVPTAQLQTAVTRALRKRQGLTISGNPRKHGRATISEKARAFFEGTAQPPAPASVPAQPARAIPLPPVPPLPAALGLPPALSVPVKRSTQIYTGEAAERMAERKPTNEGDMEIVRQAQQQVEEKITRLRGK